jgi:hypothetical protein
LALSPKRGLMTPQNARRSTARAVRRVGVVARFIGLVTLGVTLASAAAQAQSSPVLGPFPSWPGGALEPAAIGPLSETVLKRGRPDYDPLGVRLGAFVIHPSIDIAGTYDSNVFATPKTTATPVKGDFFVTEVPALSIASDWNEDAISLNMSGAFKQYASLSSENVNNFQTEASGRYDISNGQYLAVDAIYQLLHEDRQSPNAVTTAKNPIEYKVMGADLIYVRQVGRLGMRVDNTLTSYDFNNASTAAGVTIPENFRDRNEFVVAPRLNYEIIPGYNAFVRVIGNERQYFSQELGGGPHGENVRRNSHGWEVDAGTAIEITRITTAEVYVGYLKQYYENPLLKSPSGVGFGGNLIWNVTPITTVRGSFSQAVAETTLNGASSSLETGVQLSVEHELLRNVLLLASVGFVHDDYQQAAPARSDDTFGADIGARYLLNRNWTATADLNYSQRDSNVPNGNYRRFQGIVSVKYGF